MACNSANNPASSSQGKKNRKTKGKKMELSVFLNEDTNKETPDGYTVVTSKNWADYTVDDEEDKSFDHRRDIINHNRPIVLPTAPKSARAPDIDLSKIPNHPPFKAYLGNLPYETTEEEIERFFKNKKVARVHLVRDGDRGRPRGVGFVEFEDRETLIDALGQNGETLKNRAIRVSISEDRGSGYEDRSRRIDEDRTSNDWRSDIRELPPARNGNDYPSYDNDSYRGRRMDRSSGGFDRSYNRERDFGDVRSEPRDFNRFDRDSRDNNFQDNRDRGPRDSYGRGDRSFDDRRDRRSFDDRREGRGFDDRRDGRGFDERRDVRGFDGGRDERRYERRQYDRQDDRRGERSMGSDHGSDRGSDRGFRDRPLDRERRNFSSNFDRRSSAASPSPPVSTDSRGEDEQREAPKERPKLMLQPRTKPLQVKVEHASDSTIFGEAKPVDTAAREREIEEKLQASLKLDRDLDKTSRGSAAGSGPNSEIGSIVGDGDNGRDSPVSSPRLSQSQSEAERVEPQRKLD